MSKFLIWIWFGGLTLGFGIGMFICAIIVRKLQAQHQNELAAVRAEQQGKDG